MTAMIAIDLLVGGLLVATLMFAWRLDRRLAVLRQEKAALIDLMRDFRAASEQADTSLRQLRETGSEIARNLEGLVAKGQGLRGDLGFMIERAEPLADRLTESLRPQRPAASRAGISAGQTARSGMHAKSASDKDVERELARLLSGLR
jgi:hypothetical protein